MFHGFDFGDDFLHHRLDAVFEGRPAVGTVAASPGEFHNHDVIVGKFNEVDVAAVLLEVGTYLIEDVGHFAKDGFSIHISFFFTDISLSATSLHFAEKVS